MRIGRRNIVLVRDRSTVGLPHRRRNVLWLVTEVHGRDVSVALNLDWLVVGRTSVVWQISLVHPVGV